MEVQLVKVHFTFLSIAINIPEIIVRTDKENCFIASAILPPCKVWVVAMALLEHTRAYKHILIILMVDRV